MYVILWTDAGLCIYLLFVWSNLILLPTQSCLVLYSFWANLLHSLMWLMVSSLSPRNQHLLFLWRLIYSYFHIIGSYGVVLCFDLLTRPKMPFKVMHRKEVTHSNGSYERKSRWRKLADEMGRAKNSNGTLQSDAPEESDLWTAWQLFPLDDD